MRSLAGYCLGSVAGLVAVGACGARPDLSAATVQARAGCYELVFGPPLHWRPAALSRVDTVSGMRLRVVLTSDPDSASPMKHAFQVQPNRAPTEVFVWWPTRSGIQLREWGADTRFEVALAGADNRLTGEGRSDGTIVGGAYHSAVLAKKLTCEGFAPGYVPPRPMKSGA